MSLQTADKPSCQVGAGFSPHINQIESKRLQPLRNHFLGRGRFVINAKSYCNLDMISCSTCLEGRVRSCGSVPNGSSTRFSSSVKFGFSVSR
jgi:hypothetical protein